MLNTIWVLAVWTVITRPRPPLPLRTGRGGRGKSGGFFILMITGWFPTGTHGHAYTHAPELYLLRNVQPVILGSDKWGVHEVRSFYKYLCVCVSLCLSPVLRRDSSLQAGKSLTALSRKGRGEGRSVCLPRSYTHTERSHRCGMRCVFTYGSRTHLTEGG